MSELLEFVASPWSSIGLVLLLFGLGPSALLRVVVRAYPATHPRRAELLAEFEQVPYRRRPLWVAALVPVCLDEGTGARSEHRRAQAAHRTRVQLAERLVDESDVKPQRIEERLEVRRRGTTSSHVTNRYVVVIDGEEIEVVRTFSGRRRWWRR